MGRLLFAPIGIAGGLIAGLISKKAFDFVWGKFSDEEPPEPDERQASLAALVGALALQGAIFRLSKGLVDRGTRAGVMRLTGSWPGEKRPEPS